MRDDAVAPIIAIMLILAAVATFFVIFNGAYIPSLKEASEIEHIRNVESSFQRFSSDIETAISLRQDNLILGEPVQLGGGECLFNTLRSGGSLAIEDEPEPAYNLSLYNSSGIMMSEMNSTLATITYSPAGNFWQDQGYRWQRGYLNVTKYGTRQVPLTYNNMTDVMNDFDDNTSSLNAFARSFGSVEFTRNLTTLFPDYDEDGNITAYLPREGNCSGITITVIQISASPDHPFTSSNGVGTLQLKTVVNTTTHPDVGWVAVTSHIQQFGNRTLDQFNDSFSEADSACGSNIDYLGYIGDTQYLYLRQTVSPVSVKVKTVMIEIGAY